MAARVKKTRRASSGKTSKVARWGNSLAIRIPSDGVEKLGLCEGAEVSVMIEDDAMVVRPAKSRRRWSLDELLKGVTPAIAGGAVDWGPPVGKEVV